MATKKIELTVAEQLEQALKIGFEQVLALNDKQDKKKIFRAAVGHGYQELEPIEIAASTLPAWAMALTQRGLAALTVNGTKSFEKCGGKLETALKNVAKAEVSAKPGPLRIAQESLASAKLQQDYCRRWSTGDKSVLYAEYVNVAKSCARGSHTHDGKLVNAESGLRIFKIAAPVTARVPYLFSRTAASERQLSVGFAHKPNDGESALLFYALFTFKGVKTSFMQLLQGRHPAAVEAFLEAGWTAEAIEQVQDVFGVIGEAPSFAETSLPQQLWPATSGDGEYLALQSAPSLATYNAIVRETRRKREGMYVPKTQMQVGSGQAQNISIFASSTSGFLTLFDCAPPRTTTTQVKALMRKCWRKSLVAIPSYGTRSKRDEDFEKSISQRPNAQRTRFLKYFANKHVAEALVSLNTARDHYSSADEDWETSVDQLALDEKKYVVSQSLLTQGEFQNLLEKVFMRIPKASLETHVLEDQMQYRDLVKKELELNCRA